MSASSFSAGARLAGHAERVLERLIGESSVAARLAAELDGERFTVLVEGLSLGVEMTAAEGGVRLRPFVTVGAASAPRSSDTSNDGGVAAQRPLPPKRSPRAATLRATPFDLLRLLRGRGLANLRGTRAELTGSLDVAEKYAALFEHAKPDLEEEVSRWVGDYAAHAFGSWARRTHAWLDRAARSLVSDTGEFLQEEARALPAAVEARGFYAEVERLRDDVERAAARLELLTGRRAFGTRPPAA